MEEVQEYLQCHNGHFLQDRHLPSRQPQPVRIHILY